MAASLTPHTDFDDAPLICLGRPSFDDFDEARCYGEPDVSFIYATRRLLHEPKDSRLFYRRPCAFTTAPLGAGRAARAAGFRGEPPKCASQDVAIIIAGDCRYRDWRRRPSPEAARVDAAAATPEALCRRRGRLPERHRPSPRSYAYVSSACFDSH